MYIRHDKTPMLQRIKEFELQNFVDSLRGTIDTANHGFETVHKGNVVVPVDIEQQAVNNLMYH